MTPTKVPILENSPNEPSKGIGRVLIVDDEYSTRNLFQSAMRAAGIPFDTCSSAAAARTRVNEGGISIVVIDIHMPDEGGRSLAEWLTERYPKIRILFITADAQAANEDLRYDTILKPVDPLKLAEMVRAYCFKVATDQRLDAQDIMLEKVMAKLEEIQAELTPSGIVSKFLSDKALMMMVAAASAIFGAYAKKMGWL